MLLLHFRFYPLNILGTIILDWSGQETPDQWQWEWRDFQQWNFNQSQGRLTSLIRHFTCWMRPWSGLIKMKIIDLTMNPVLLENKSPRECLLIFSKTAGIYPSVRYFSPSISPSSLLNLPDSVVRTRSTVTVFCSRCMLCDPGLSLDWV